MMPNPAILARPIRPIVRPMLFAISALILCMGTVLYAFASSGTDNKYALADTDKQLTHEWQTISERLNKLIPLVAEIRHALEGMPGATPLKLEARSLPTQNANTEEEALLARIKQLQPVVNDIRQHFEEINHLPPSGKATADNKASSNQGTASIADKQPAIIPPGTQETITQRPNIPLAQEEDQGDGEPGLFATMQEFTPLLAASAAALLAGLGLIWYRRKKPTRKNLRQRNPIYEPEDITYPTEQIRDFKPAEATVIRTMEVQPTIQPSFTQELTASPPLLQESVTTIQPTVGAKATPTQKPAKPTPLNPVPVKVMEDPSIELAEIMMGMGLTEGAAQTLIEQIRTDPKQSLGHWLKLLEIYRKAGEQTKFEDTARELTTHFNVKASDWSDPANEHEEDLESMPHLIEKISNLWGTPDCVEFISHLLADNRGGSRSGLPQAVAEDALLLIAILQERDKF